MIINLKRIFTSDDSTLGALYVDSKPQCFTLEDEYREEKVSGETRIPAGTYVIKFRQELTDLTQKYRKKYDWFTYHLHLQDVPNFSGIYMHIGNTDKHSEGCILCGNTINNNQENDGFLGNSRAAFKKFYKKVSDALENDEDVTILIEDIG